MGKWVKIAQFRLQEVLQKIVCMAIESLTSTSLLHQHSWTRRTTVWILFTTAPGGPFLILWSRKILLSLCSWLHRGGICMIMNTIDPFLGGSSRTHDLNSQHRMTFQLHVKSPVRLCEQRKFTIKRIFTYYRANYLEFDWVGTCWFFA